MHYSCLNVYSPIFFCRRYNTCGVSRLDFAPAYHEDPVPGSCVRVVPMPSCFLFSPPSYLLGSKSGFFFPARSTGFTCWSHKHRHRHPAARAEAEQRSPQQACTALHATTDVRRSSSASRVRPVTFRARHPRPWRPRLRSPPPPSRPRSSLSRGRPPWRQ